MNPRVCALLGVLLLPVLVAQAEFNPAGYALNFNGLNNYVSVGLTSPPASNYTLTAWVYLRSGGNYGSQRIGVLSSTSCGGSIELLVRSSTASATDPQYVELGRCGSFNGFTNTIPVLLNTWTHLAVTVSSNNTVSYFVNGNPAGSFTDLNPAHHYALGTSVTLGDNTTRRFNGLLDEFQIWTRVLSPPEIWANRNRSLTGSETGLYAVYHFDENFGVSTVNSAVAGGSAAGILVNSPTWVSSGVMLLDPMQVTFAGAQTNLGVGWRTSSQPKPLDLDGDNVLGSDGYSLVGRTAVLPGYVSLASILTSTYPGNTSYSLLDDPTNLASLFTTGTMNPFPGLGTNANIFQFTLNSNAVGRKIRVGLLVDNLDAASFNASSLNLRQLYGNQVTGGPVATIAPALNDRVPDWLFFDLANPADGDVFVVQGMGGTNGAATLGGVIFDSQPPTLLVTSLNDAGPGSLRALLAAAPAGTTLAFATNLSGQTIYLTSGPLAAGNTLTIDASGLPGGLTLSGGGTNGILMVPPGENLTLVGLTFSQGRVGGTGGAIYSAAGSVLHIARCVFTGNVGLEGGAILNDGLLFMENSTLTGNLAAYGGALQCRAPAVLTHCTLVANNGDSGGGGIWNKGAKLTLNNCIVAQNSSVSLGSDIYSQSALLILQNANLVQVSTNDNPANTTGPAPLTNTPQLAVLANYGGPTKTMPPLQGSPAIDAGGPTALFLDQRGLPRMIGPAADLGAAEYYQNSPEISSTIDSGPGSLRFGLVHMLPGVISTVSFAPALSGQTIMLTNGQIILRGGITLDASAVGGVVINGNQNGTVFNITSGAAARLSGFTITNASNSGIINAGSLIVSNCSVLGNVSAANGGGISSAGTLTMTGCSIGSNRSTLNGGGIYSSGLLILTDTKVWGNTAGTNRNGGGIALAGSATAFLTNCIISGNATLPGSGSGGGILSFGTLNLCNCTLSSNTVPGGAGGGAIANVGPMQLWGCAFIGNSASVQGGAIDNEWPSMAQNCTFTGNTSDYGGAVLNNYNHSARFSLMHCTLTDNHATHLGGAIYNSGNTVDLTNTIAAANTAPEGGADIQNADASVLNAGGTNLVQDLANLAVVNGAASLVAAPPLLAPIGNYGGPTPTMPPLGGSPAIDAGSDTALTGLVTDQRGFPRLAGSRVDIGAVEITPGSIVTTAADSGPGSLRQILATLTSPNLISFAPNLSGQIILLTGGALTMDKSLSIDGSGLGNGIHINGNASSPVLIINEGITVALNTLTLTNGYDSNGAFAGGIANAGNLTLNYCNLAGNGGANGAGGIYNSGTVALNRSTVAGNWANLGDGGGLYNEGLATITSSTISGNSLMAGNGGGIWNDSELVIENSTVAANAANGLSSGGSSSRVGHGGAICSRGSAVILNSTLASNSASISGGGIEVFDGPVAATNSIVAGNSAPSAANIAGTFAGANNLTGGNALLAPLNAYGGPTRTMPPLFGSPAIDAGNDDATNRFAIDQRGLPRRSGSRVDLGAVEFQAGLLVLSNSDSGESSLRAAVTYSPPGSTVTFATNLSGQVILLTNGFIRLNRNLVIDGSALSSPVQINGNSNSPVFVVNYQSKVAMSSLIITNGYDSSGRWAGGICNIGTLSLSNCLIVANGQAVLGGGGIYNDYDSLTMDGCTLAGNWTATNDGGGILNSGRLTMNNCTLTGNRANAGNGGAIANGFYGALYGMVANHCTVVQNHASDLGAGIFGGTNGSTALTNCIVSANSAPASPDISGAFLGLNILTNQNPLLAPLGYYGGRTPTLPPLAGSPAIDAGSDATLGFLALDQRGAPRQSGQHVDLGAVEVQIANTAPTLTRGRWILVGASATPSFQSSFTNLQYGSFSVFAATNLDVALDSWSNIGPAVETPSGSGQFLFTDVQATNYPRRYYRVSSP